MNWTVYLSGRKHFYHYKSVIRLFRAGIKRIKADDSAISVCSVL